MGIDHTVSVLSDTHPESARQLALEFDWQLDNQEADVLLLWHEGKLSIHIQADVELAKFKPTFFDYSQLVIGDHKQPLSRAFSLRKQSMRILDACAGTGVDSFILNRLGAELHSFERNPLVFALLRDAFERTGPVDAWNLYCGDSAHALLSPSQTFDAVYCDPMFSSATKRRGAERKEMRILRYLEDDADDSSGIIPAAAASAIPRLVIKRPLRATARQFPQRHLLQSIDGKGFSFDVYGLNG